MSEKILPTHLERAAYVYVRQSTLQQVRHHREGQQRQYALSERARQLLFANVVVVDDDLGISGSGKLERPGFARLLTAVCQGEVGAVFALEASRLARNNRDWHHLIDLCAMTDTLLIDDDGIYDPRLVNDRLLLGLKGTMSEFELSLFRQRAREAFEQKIKRGHAMWELPVGYVRTDDDRVQKSPNLQVQQAVEMVFRKFRELGSARQTLLYFRDEQVRLPEVIRGTSGEEIVWRLPCQSRIIQMLRNPCYAGVLVYGRTRSGKVVAGEQCRRMARSTLPAAQWKIVLRDHHEAYVSWEEYESNQRQLYANQSRRDGTNTAAARGGAALLSGLLRCGRCGRVLFVGYTGNHGTVPRYVCRGDRVERGSAGCQSAGSLRIDRAVTDLLLQAIQPAGIEAAMQVAQRTILEDTEKRCALEMALESARYDARLAQRQFDAVDPDNRLVASELESRWNQALERAREAEIRLKGHQAQSHPLGTLEQQQLRELAGDLRLVWDHPVSTVELKKRILRSVIEEIVLDREDEHHHVLRVHWKGGMHVALQVKRNGTGSHSRVTNENAVELVEELSKIYDDKTIALVLNRLGYRTGQGKTWRQYHISSLRYTRGLPNHGRTGAWLSLEASARELEVSNTVIRRLIIEGVLPATQVVPNAPWIIERSSLDLPAVQHRICAVRNGRKLPSATAEQCELPLK